MKKKDHFETLPELAPDLEWMLQGGEIETQQLAEALVEAYYPPVVALGWLLLNNGEAARYAAIDGLSLALANRYRYQGKEDVEIWIYRQVLAALREGGRRRRVEGALWATSPPAAVIDLASMTAENMGPWLLGRIASLVDRQKMSVLLRYACQWPEEKIARLLRTEEGEIRLQLHNALTMIASAWNDARKKPAPQVGASVVAPGLLSSQDIDRILISVLPGSGDSVSNEDHQVVARMVFDLAERRSSANQRFSSIKETVLVAVTVLAVAGVLWVANMFIPEEKPAVVATDTLHTAADSSILTFATPTVGATPTRVPAAILPAPLSANSSPKEVLERVAMSASLWNTLWADVTIRQYGAPGYIGPPLEYRSQVWISQPDQRRLLVGPVSGRPEYAVISDSGISSVYRLGDNLVRARNLGSLTNNPSLETLLYPNQFDFFQKMGRLRLEGMEKIAGQSAIKMVWADLSSSQEYHIWVDAYRGVLLRSQEFEGKITRTLVQESDITQIFYDVDFQYPDLFDAAMPQLAGYFRDYHTSPDSDSEHPYHSPQAVEPGRLERRSPPPAGYDPNKNALVFQYPQDYLDAGMPSGRNPVVDLFSGGYYLGSLKFARPWNLICRRSPDGSTIAFSDLTGWDEFIQDNWRTARIYWFNLADLQIKTLPGEGHAHAMAFSPDSRNLAFFGTASGPDYTGPGVYLLDTKTGAYRLLLAVDRAEELRWSRDGKYLLVRTSPGEQPEGIQQVILEASTGKTVTETLFDESVIVWEPSSPVNTTGLADCAARPTGN